ncbi:MAG: DEAD/DEAH box helicase [Clostridia bacterium]|nr:DEAD/DEAH box helicase [Clostridia bacterium]
MAVTVSVRLLDVPFHLDRPFTYLLPAGETRARVGSVVRIPFGRSDRTVLGVVTGVGEGDEDELKTIREVLPDRCSLSGEMFGLALFLSDYTLCTLGEAVRTLLPPTLFSNRLNVKTERTYAPADESLIRERLSDTGRGKIRSGEVRSALENLLADPTPKKAEDLALSPAQIRTLVERGLLSVSECEVIRNPYADLANDRDPSPIVLSRAQTAAYEKITSLPADKPRAALLHGVTGSGKTKVMLKLLDGMLAAGKTAIVMVPEIALTPQTVGIFCRRYGERVAVIHSSLGAGERFDAWRRIASGEVDLVIGTRSAVFAPLPRLGMIVIDEEHEHTYKSESDPKYHARDVAAYRCGVNNALLLLASATPSLESYTKAKNGQ